MRFPVKLEKALSRGRISDLPNTNIYIYISRSTSTTVKQLLYYFNATRSTSLGRVECWRGLPASSGGKPPSSSQADHAKISLPAYAGNFYILFFIICIIFTIHISKSYIQIVYTNRIRIQSMIFKMSDPDCDFMNCWIRIAIFMIPIRNTVIWSILFVKVGLHNRKEDGDSYLDLQEIRDMLLFSRVSER